MSDRCAGTDTDAPARENGSSVPSLDERAIRARREASRRAAGRWVVWTSVLLAFVWACSSTNSGIAPPPGGGGGTGGAGGLTPGARADSGGPVPPAPDDWCSARKVLEENCVSCHFVGTPWATIPLVTYDELQERLPSGVPAYVSVGQRIHDPTRLMPPTNDRLTPVELATLDNWIAAGAKAGANPTCAPGGGPDASDGTGGAGGAGGGGGSAGTAGSGGSGAGGLDGGGGSDGGRDASVDAADASDASDGRDSGPTDAGTDGDGGTRPPTGWPTDCEERYTVVAHGVSQPGDKTKFSVSGAMSRDFHQCFLFKAPWGTSVVQALRFRPIVDDARVVSRFALYGLQSSSGADGQVGASGCRNGAYLHGWAPGANETPLPPDVGLQMPSGPNAFVALEIHYDNSAGHRDAEDASGLEFCVTKKLRKNTASVHVLGSTNFSLPPRTQTSVSNTCDPATTQPVTLVSVLPQMNRLATRSRLVLNRSGSPSITLQDVPFDVASQITYPLSAIVNNGNTLTTTCTYNNTTSSPVRFGTSLNDENCYAFVTAYPAGALSAAGTPNRCIGF